MEKIATRDAYGDVLVELGEKNKDIVVLDADVSVTTRTYKFAKKFPNRFFDMGVAEQNMMVTAAGLSTCGKIPIVSTFAVFATERAYNQIRQTIAYPNFNVKIVASHSGISVGADGASHQTTMDIAIMRVMPNMTVIVPADAIETKVGIRAIVDYKGPVYVRLGRPPVPLVYEEGYRYGGSPLKFEIGRAVTLRGGEDVTIIATGIMVAEALSAANILAKEEIEARVINVHTIKPIDEEIIVKVAKETGAIVTAEEHSVIGGLGGAVAEILVEHISVPMLRIGIKDKFGESGSAEGLLEKYGLTARNIVNAVQNVVQRKT
ncbi:MAG: transketolase family protein [Candidatus Bathyarchaeota archaeon]|nr:transketolase family protein [Candidatus Bathyarchaeota archaeon]